jgi:LacI family transcriptional regulator
VVGHRRSEVRGLVNVVTNSEEIGRLGAEHLLKCGFRHFAYCGYLGTAREQTPWSKLRLESFRRRIAEAGFDEPMVYTVPGSGLDWRRERNRLANWLAKLPRPTGVMACNDDCGVQVIESGRLAGLAIPDDIGILGVDNDEVICGLSDPPLTSIAISFERAGYEAAAALNLLMAKSVRVPPRIHALASHVVARRSTDVVAAGDPGLAKVLRFIRDHSRRPLTVSEVAREAGFSRRGLERRFRSLMGGSVLGEIRRARTNQIVHLLLETTLPIGQIAELLGFEGVQHFSRYFRSGKGVSPLSFRKTYGSPLTSPVSQNGDLFPQSGVSAPAKAG